MRDVCLDGILPLLGEDGWRIDTSLFEDPDAVRATFEVPRPSSDFEALVMLSDSTADVTAELPVAR